MRLSSIGRNLTRNSTVRRGLNSGAGKFLGNKKVGAGLARSIYWLQGNKRIWRYGCSSYNRCGHGRSLW